MVWVGAYIDTYCNEMKGYRGLAEATGCSIDFNMLGEATAEEKTNIMLASGDMTDFYTGLGSYGNNLTSATASTAWRARATP